MSILDNPIILDPRNEEILTQEAKLYAFQQSNGVINSLNEGDPLDVLVRSQAYVGAELLFYANQTPLAFAVKFLELTGVQRSTGTKSTAIATFRLISERPSSFLIPAGFEVTGEQGGVSYSFYTTQDLVIEAGQLQGAVTVEAKETGSAYNLSAGLIRNITQPLAFLQSVVNFEAAQGGTDAETEASAVQRAVSVLSRRSPISALDYEREAESILGVGSRCKAIGLLAADRETEEKGAVHLFLLSSSATPANDAEIIKVRNIIEPKTQIGTRLYISPMQTIEVVAEVIVKINDSAIPTTVADDLWNKFREVLNPVTYESGATVDPSEMAHFFRFVDGIKYVEEVYLNGDGLPIALPNAYTLPIVKGILCRMVDEKGSIFTEVRGSGNDID